MIQHALIMAAGRGARMMPLTADIPKAMAPYDGSTLIARGLDRVGRFVPNVYVTVGYKGALLAEHVISHGVSGIFDTSGRNNAWWIFNTLMRSLDEPVFVLTCDNVWFIDFTAVQEEYYRFGSPWCMVIPVEPVKGLDGDYIHHIKGRVAKISRAEIAATYCSGIQVLNPKRIHDNLNKCDNFYELWAQLISANQLYTSSVSPTRWFAADTLDQLDRIPLGL
jgi:NDP-sugar pyrophosphorylase family protein